MDFEELKSILSKLEFQERIKGSHHIYFKESIQDYKHSAFKWKSEALPGKTGKGINY